MLDNFGLNLKLLELPVDDAINSSLTIGSELTLYLLGRFGYHFLDISKFCSLLFSLKLQLYKLLSVSKYTYLSWIGGNLHGTSLFD